MSDEQHPRGRVIVLNRIADAEVFPACTTRSTSLAPRRLGFLLSELRRARDIFHERQLR